MTLRGALVGFGFIGERGHVPAYLERAKTRRDVSLVAVADVCPARRKAAAAALPGVKIYDDHRRMLDDGELELDFVDIATPPCDHANIAHDAFDAGLHVLCEKPMAVTAKSARSMVTHARRVERVLYPCHTYKHAPVIRSVRELLQASGIGTIHQVSLHTMRATHARGVVEWRPDWRRERRIAGGGIAMDHGSHTLYLAFDWMGGYPTSVSAKTWTLGPYDTEDNFTCTLTFPNGLVTAHLTWTASVRKVLYTLHGEHGAIRVEDDSIELAMRKSGRKPGWDVERWDVPSEWMDASHAHWFGSLLDEFMQAIAHGQWVNGETIQALRSVELIETAYRSAKKRCQETPFLRPGEEEKWMAVP